MVIDVKYAVPPFGALDIRYDIRGKDGEGGMEEWKRKMSEYVTAFQQFPDILDRGSGGANRSDAIVFGLILLRWPFPIPVEFESPIGAVDWPSLKHHLENTTAGSISELFDWVNKRPDLPVPPRLVWTPKDVKAGDWTYKYFVLKSPDSGRKPAG